MLSYITIGANDPAASTRFYAAILLPLGYTMEAFETGTAFTPPGGGHGTVYVTTPFDGQAATIGNGTMAAFRVPTHAQLRALHAAGQESGGTNEGDPGFRPQYTPHFFVAYLRDPVGNKLALFCDDPAQGSRDQP